MGAHDGELVYRCAAGLADREERRPMSLDSIFRLSSLAKPIVSATALPKTATGKIQRFKLREREMHGGTRA